MFDDLGDRMKEFYENRTRIYLPRKSYTIIRIDGKAFHSYTKNLKRPFDDGLINEKNSFKKVVVEATDEDFEKAKKYGDHVVITESSLEGKEVALAFAPMEKIPNFLKSLLFFGS